jgi:hypothetical protein
MNTNSRNYNLNTIHKAWACYYLSSFIINKTDERFRPMDYGVTLLSDMLDLCWYHAEEWAFKKMKRMETGRCSIQEMLDFIPENFELELEQDFEKMREIALIITHHRDYKFEPNKW